MLVVWERSHVFSKIFRKHAMDAIPFFFEKLDLEDHHHEQLVLTITPSWCGKDSGYTSVEEVENGKITEITIGVHPKRDEKMATLAHECVHVRQYLLGELSDDEGESVWKGRTWADKREDELDEYFNFPWEIEAYGLERGLVFRYLEHLKRTNALYPKELTVDDFQKHM